MMLPNIHIGSEIRKQLNVQRSVNWLAEKIDYDQSNLNKYLKMPHLNSKLMYRISIALGIDLFSLYSQFLSDALKVADEKMVKFT